jgi:hypothetical protein
MVKVEGVVVTREIVEGGKRLQAEAQEAEGKEVVDNDQKRIFRGTRS